MPHGISLFKKNKNIATQKLERKVIPQFICSYFHKINKCNNKHINEINAALKLHKSLEC